jgi:hypothetical protein
MRKFTEIELFLLEPYTIEEQKEFIFRSCSICNFVERKLQLIDHLADRSRVNIKCTLNKELTGVTPYKNEPYLEACIFYDIQGFLDFSQKKFFDHCSSIIAAGIEEANKHTALPCVFISSKLQEFKDAKYENSWVHTEKEWPSKSLKSIITAELNITELNVWQEIIKNGDTIARKIIAKEIPRTALFHRVLGSLAINRSGEIVYKTRKNVISKFNVGKNVFIDLS